VTIIASLVDTQLRKVANRVLDENTEEWLRSQHPHLNIELAYDPEEGWFVRAHELPGCTTGGDSVDEALYMIADAIHGWVEATIYEE
jgi:predicted RNase H-like HicB family nuclease